MNFDKVPELPDTPEPQSWNRRKLTWVLVGVVLASAGVGYWQFAPAWPTAAREALVDRKTTARIADLDAELQSISTRLDALPPDGSLEARAALLAEGVARQNEVRRLRPVPWPSDSDRLSQWQNKLENTVARIKDGQSRDLEAAADGLVRQNQIPLAVEKLKAALKLQREVNDSLAVQQVKSYGRQAELQGRVEELGAEPLQIEQRQALTDARAAVAGSHWADAQTSYRHALELQEKLNRDYPHSRYSDMMAVDRLRAEMASLSATGEHDQMLASLQQAAAAAAAGHDEEADRLYQQAAAQQKEINGQYSRSRFVSMEQLEQIEIERQTLRARATIAIVHDLDEKAARHLRKRELFQAQEQVALADRDLEGVIARQPKAQGLEDDLRQRLGYLNLRSADLVQIQDQTYELLAPLPGDPHFALLKTEVPQTLFAKVMNANPSRNPGRNLPVDSVTYAEADEFCRRLGWVLGATVRLPTEAEFKAAVGDAAAGAAVAWTRENSSNQSQPMAQKPANALGFYDLLGNLAEWTQVEVGDTSDLAGGSFADPKAVVQGVPFQRVAKVERARTTGFRVVVELDLAGPK